MLFTFCVICYLYVWQSGFCFSSQSFHLQLIVEWYQFRNKSTKGINITYDLCRKTLFQSMKSKPCQDGTYWKKKTIWSHFPVLRIRPQKALWSPGPFWPNDRYILFFTRTQKTTFFSLNFKLWEKLDFGAYCIFNREIQPVNYDHQQFFLKKLE